jgi:two-component system chemotaxis sensor kinase CheA
LIVEDSLTTRELEKNILKSAGFQVDTAVDGIDAFNKIAEEKPDLIVTDIQMPRMDGFKMTEKLKQDTKYKNIPVVMVTALVKDEEKRRGIEVGADAYITKTSFNQAYLIEIIERFIG